MLVGCNGRHDDYAACFGSLHGALHAAVDGYKHMDGRKKELAMEIRQKLISSSNASIREFCACGMTKRSGSGRAMGALLADIALLVPHRPYEGVFLGDGGHSGGNFGLVPISIDDAMRDGAIVGLMKVFRAIFDTHGVEALLLEECALEAIIRTAIGESFGQDRVSAGNLLEDVANARGNSLGRFFAKSVFHNYAGRYCIALEGVPAMVTCGYECEGLRVLYIAGHLSFAESLILKSFKSFFSFPGGLDNHFAVYQLCDRACMVRFFFAPFASHDMRDVRQIAAWRAQVAKWVQFLLKTLSARMPQTALTLLSRYLGIGSNPEAPTISTKPQCQSKKLADFTVIEEVIHADPAAEIHPGEAAQLAAIQHAGFIERNLGVGFEPEEQEQLLLLHFNRTSQEMVLALSEGPALKPCRTALENAGFQHMLASGAFVFVQPWQYHMGIGAAQERLGAHGLKSSHIIVAQSLEYLVEESLGSIKGGIWAKDRQQLLLSEDQIDMSSQTACASQPASEGHSSEPPVVCVEQHTFLCWVPRFQPSAHSGAHTV
mmetsp:Transcript_75311/g.161354  ORF Transcript_75311/g.161354 Transcript_75311/m.161354 type:complete len:546 (-) Transcript_75311:104-1741(-)